MAVNLKIDRTFTDAPAVRHATPLLFAVYGASGSGKTYSALRLATGIQRVSGGDIWCIDTESNRSLRYADKFTFRHVPFAAPFSSLDYLASIEHCVSKGAKVIIVDSMSHEHENVGGYLEQHDLEVERIMAAWRCNEDKANIPAWNKPSRHRRHMINRILQLNCNFIFCFRAKEKVKPGGGKVTELGYMPIAGEEFIFEMSATALLLPKADGVPTWNPEGIGEKSMVKNPDEFRPIFAGEPRPLDEKMGEEMAAWSAGKAAPNAQDLLDAYRLVDALPAFEALEADRKVLWRTLAPGDMKTALKEASDEAKKRVTA